MGKDLDDLRQRLRYPIPEILVAEYERIRAAVAAVGEEESVDVVDVLDFELADTARRYHNTPPELFPFGWTGVGGVHYGHVIHAPEASGQDWPVAIFSPTDHGAGACCVGATTAEAIANLLAKRLEDARDNFEEEELAAVRSVHRRLRFTAPRGSASQRIYGPDGNGIPVPAPRRAGYAHVPFEDGIGVFAPVAAFLAEDLARPRPVHPEDEWPKPLPEGALAAARALLPGHPASALLRLKELAWHGQRDLAVPLLIEAYGRLDRGLIVAGLAVDA
jgi:hypothetical protein